MITVNWKLIDKASPILVGCSGGVDSQAVVNFLKHFCKEVIPVFFHHDTETSEAAYLFLQRYYGSNNFYVGRIQNSKKKSESWEEYWRNERLTYFKSLGQKIVTAHNLGDCIETYIWSCLHGEAKLPKWDNGVVIRPFLKTPKAEFINWCKDKNIPWVEDGSNLDTRYTRNLIRHELLPMALRVNKGLEKTIRKKLVY